MYTKEPIEVSATEPPEGIKKIYIDIINAEGIKSA
jgi:hypothetical protein